MPRRKKVPKRVCVGCQQTKEKKNLIRIVRTPDQVVKTDLTGKLSGRGAYLCKDIKCLEAALAGKRLQHALKLDLPQELIEDIKKTLLGE
jgi:predicted RNA-binding protein YlxR (DUF448 family)